MRISFLLRSLLVTGLASFTLGCTNLPSNSEISADQWPSVLHRVTPPQVLLLGEQHDAPEHQQWQHATAQNLIARQQLAAVVLEMADQGQDTDKLPRTATEQEVQTALQWNDKGWPWQAYGPAIMTAVRAGIPVFGGNLPRANMRQVMQDSAWDSHLPPAAWEQQRQAIRIGHCDLLPENQITPMARIQLAKDARMAQTIAPQVQAGKTVLLIAGRGHVLRSMGIPTWLPAEISRLIAIGQAGGKAQADRAESDYVVRTPALADKDHCADLRAQWGQSPPNK
jgi:uncharacterized iron-regulated protein